MTCCSPGPDTAPDAGGPGAQALQRAEGGFRLSARASGGRTRLAGLHQHGCCRLLFPRRGLPQLEAVMVNISGGLAAGDMVRGEIDCQAGAALTLGSQGHERVYRARPGEAPTRMTVTCQVGPHAVLEWLPHGTIFFEGSQLVRQMQVDLAPTARFLFYESRIYGRHGSDEHPQTLYLRDRLSLRRAGRPLLEERTSLGGTAMQALFQHPAIAGGAHVETTLVLVDDGAEALLPQIRPLLAEAGEEASFAASCWGGRLVVRGLSRSNWVAERLMHRLLPIVRGQHPLPVGWRI